MSALLEVLETARRHGFLGPGDPREHLRHTDAFAALLGSPERAVDLGTGGGVPGLVLACSTDRTHWSLLEGSTRRSAFLRRAVRDLGVQERVEVIAARAEDVGRWPSHRAGHDVATARGFGAPAVVAECAAPLLAVGGRLVVSEPPGPSEPERWPAEGLARFGLRLDAVHDVGARMAVIEQVTPCPERFPRRVGVPVRRPVF